MKESGREERCGEGEWARPLLVPQITELQIDIWSERTAQCSAIQCSVISTFGAGGGGGGRKGEEAERPLLPLGHSGILPPLPRALQGSLLCQVQRGAVSALQGGHNALHKMSSSEAGGRVDPGLTPR